MRRLILLLIVFVIPWLPIYSNTFRFKHITVFDGLSQKWVKCIYRDRVGYLWIGTSDGLNRYDGISIKTYKFSLSDPHSLNFNNITAIYEDSKGNLWIGTQEGLNKYVRDKDHFIRIPSINNYVSSFCELKDGTFYVGSTGGLFILNTENYKARMAVYTQIESIVQDKYHQVWLGTHNGLFKLDTKTNKYKQIRLTNEIEPLIRSMFIDCEGRMWIGTVDQGLYLLRQVNDSFDKPAAKHYYNIPGKPESLRKGTIYAIAEDQDHSIWIGVENGGINYISVNELEKDDSSFEHLEHNAFNNYSISNNSIHSFFLDNQNTMWIGTYGNGISYTNPLLQKFGLISQQPGTAKSINNNFINAILDEDRFLFIGTEDGLNVYDKLKDKYFFYRHDINNPNSISSDVIWSIFRDSKNNLWIGTWGGGLNLFDEKNHTFKSFLNKESDVKSIGSNNITRIIEDRSGKLWIATHGGGLNLFDYNTQTFKQYRVDLSRNSISCDWLNDIAEDAQGNIWIATTRSLDFLDTRSNLFTKYINKVEDTNSISYNGAMTVFKDSRGQMWIGTSNGLNVYNKSNNGFRRYTERDGLCNNNVMSIEEDDSLNLWISTNKGISKFIKGVTLPLKPEFQNYNISDGLQENEFNMRASFKNKQGMIYFGGPNGCNVFNPAAVKQNLYIPNIVFTDLLVFNQSVKPDDAYGILTNDIGLSKEIKLAKKHSVFTIEFAALNLIAPEKNQYAYKLEGFDKQWNLAGKIHSATYTNLDPGTYNFRVRASNSDGLWNNEGIALKIIVQPGWWQTWFARAIYLLIIILGIYYFRKHTIISVNLKNQLWLDHQEKKKTEELTKLKLQFFTNISHELRTPITLIIGPLKQLIDTKTHSEKLQTIYRNSVRLKILVDQILDFSKIENQMMKLELAEKNVIDIVESNIFNFSDFANQKNISLLFVSSISKCITKVDEDKLDKILTNLLSNAIKNTPDGGEIKTLLDFDTKASKLIIVISDNGPGIAPEDIDHIFDRFFTASSNSLKKTGTGIGLNLTHKLVEMLHGTINIESSIGKGTTFQIILPFNPIEFDSQKIEKICNNKPSESQLSKILTASMEAIHDKTILIIDDNIEMIELLESSLDDSNNILKENKPEEALSRIVHYMPDLIISDVMMPVLDGFDLCRKIKSDFRFCHIPVILLTAKATIDDQIKGFDIGADDYIIKPFDSELLKARVKNLLIKKETIRQQFIGNDGIINSKAEVNSLDFSFVDQIMALIHENYSDVNLNVNHIIDKMGMSRSVFYSKLKALSNQSINDLIITFRLKKAEELLSNPNMNITEVAFACGFIDPAYFSRVFKNKYNMSPKEYRNNRLSENNKGSS